MRKGRKKTFEKKKFGHISGPITWDTCCTDFFTFVLICWYRSSGSSTTTSGRAGVARSEAELEQIMDGLHEQEV